jgi:hypothetical protein
MSMPSTDQETEEPSEGRISPSRLGRIPVYKRCAFWGVGGVDCLSDEKLFFLDLL